MGIEIEYPLGYDSLFRDTGRAAADNLWAPPPTFVARDNLSARRRCHFPVNLFCCNFR